MNAETLEQRVGTFDPEHGAVYPPLTVSGQPYDRRAAPTTRGIGNSKFVVLDTFLPRGFDLEAAIAELTAAVAPSEPKTKKASKDERDEPEAPSETL